MCYDVCVMERLFMRITVADCFNVMHPIDNTNVKRWPPAATIGDFT